MPTTSKFFLWFFYGLNGLGGWFIFLLLGMAAVIFVFYDSHKRRLPALGWRMGVLLTALLIIPAMIYRFTVDPMNPSGPLASLAEPIFYLGLLGGILPPVIAAGYFVTFQGLEGCNRGHIYDTALGGCPDCAQLDAPPAIREYPLPPAQPVRQDPIPEGQPLPPLKPKAQAWLVARDGRDYQLNLGETTLGRSAQNDIQLGGDTTVSREHAKIMEQNGHFRILDLGTPNHTTINSRIIRQAELLEPDDEIQLGDSTILRFVTTRR